MSLQHKGLHLKRFMESCGNDVRVASQKLHDLMSLEDKDPMQLRPEDFSIKELYESVNVSQFPILAGTLISKKVMQAYELAAKIGDQLVTPFPSKLLIDKVPGAYLKGTLQEIEAGMPYEHTGDVAEKYVQIEGKKRGAILDVTEEAVLFDQTGLVLQRASQFGERAALDRETKIVNTVQDITSYRAWYPSGSVATLYANAAADGIHDYDNLVTDALADYTDVQALWKLLRLMKDDDGNYINVVPKILLVPVALQIVATRIINNTVLPGAYNSETNPFANAFDVISSPLLDAQSAVDWYLGDFKRNFAWKEIFPVQVMTRKMGDKNDDAWERDIVASYKIRYYGECGALDYRFVGKADV